MVFGPIPRVEPVARVRPVVSAGPVAKVGPVAKNGAVKEVRSDPRQALLQYQNSVHVE